MSLYKRGNLLKIQLIEIFQRFPFHKRQSNVMTTPFYPEVIRGRIYDVMLISSISIRSWYIKYRCFNASGYFQQLETNCTLVIVTLELNDKYAISVAASSSYRVSAQISAVYLNRSCIKFKDKSVVLFQLRCG